MGDGGHVGFVEHLDLDMGTAIHQGRKADEGLRATAHLHQLGQLAAGPVGVAGGLRGAAVGGPVDVETFAAHMEAHSAAVASRWAS